MANEELTIQPNDARMTVIGKSWPDQASDSGGGDWDDTYNGTYSGPIPRTDLPVKIAVTTPPTKTEYEKNERIDFDGMVVTAYKEDGTVWTSEQYPDGTIPLNEIISTRITKYEDNNNVFIGNIIYASRPYENHSFLLCRHFHIEYKWYSTGVDVMRDIVTEPGYSVIVFLGNPDLSYNTPYQSCFCHVVQDRVETEEQVPPEGLLCGNGRATHGSRLYSWNYITSNPVLSDTWPNMKTASYFSRYIGHSSVRYEINSLIMVPNSFSSNIPLNIVQGGLEGLNTDLAYLTIAYCGVGKLNAVSDITLYWSRPEDGKYLSCSLPITIKSQESSENGGR